MPLSPAIEFLSAQEGPGGNKLCHFGVSQVTMVVPAGLSVQFQVTPRSGVYAHYVFRVMVDESVVPGSFFVSVAHFGAFPVSFTLYPSVLGYAHDTFLRLTHGHPSTNTVTNLTTLNQRFIIYQQSLVVATEEDFKELEQRLVDHFFAQMFVDTGPMEALLRDTNAVLRSIAAGKPPPPPPPPPSEPMWQERLRRLPAESRP